VELLGAAVGEDLPVLEVFEAVRLALGVLALAALAAVVPLFTREVLAIELDFVLAALVALADFASVFLAVGAVRLALSAAVEAAFFAAVRLVVPDPARAAFWFVEAVPAVVGLLSGVISRSHSRRRIGQYEVDPSLRCPCKRRHLRNPIRTRSLHHLADERPRSQLRREARAR
jgi:hypothetical protein